MFMCTAVDRYIPSRNPQTIYRVPKEVMEIVLKTVKYHETLRNFSKHRKIA